MLKFLMGIYLLFYCSRTFCTTPPNAEGSTTSLHLLQLPNTPLVAYSVFFVILIEFTSVGPLECKTMQSRLVLC